jgi:hypothetical protein
MKRLIRITIVSALTLLGLLIFTRYETPPRRPGQPEVTRSTGEILGYPVVSLAQRGARGVIAISQVDARGVIVFGQVGFGLIAVVQAGAGLIAGLGQGMIGLLVIAQGGLGLLFFLGQIGAGAQAAGQGVVVRRPWSHFEQMFRELDETLGGRRAGPPA